MENQKSVNEKYDMKWYDFIPYVGIATYTYRVQNQALEFLGEDLVERSKSKNLVRNLKLCANAVFTDKVLTRVALLTLWQSVTISGLAKYLG